MWSEANTALRLPRESRGLAHVKHGAYFLLGLLLNTLVLLLLLSSPPPDSASRRPDWETEAPLSAGTEPLAVSVSHTPPDFLLISRMCIRLLFSIHVYAFDYIFIPHTERHSG